MNKEISESLLNDEEALTREIATIGTDIGVLKGEIAERQEMLKQKEEYFNKLIAVYAKIRKSSQPKIEQDRSMPSVLQHNNMGYTENISKQEDRSVPSVLRHFGSYNDNYQQETEEHKSVLR